MEKKEWYKNREWSVTGRPECIKCSVELDDSDLSEMEEKDLYLNDLCLFCRNNY